MASAIPEPAFLQKLPAEIRIMIYRLALVERTNVHVTASGVIEPGLLTVCKLIRKEAGPIFYGENTIKIRVDSYSSTAIRFWTKKMRFLAKEFGTSTILYEYKGGQQPHWPNLIEWCRGFHSRQCRFGIQDSSTSRAGHRTIRRMTNTLRVACAMFAIVEKLGDRPWAEVEALLLPYREILEAVERGWKA